MSLKYINKFRFTRKDVTKLKKQKNNCCCPTAAHTHLAVVDVVSGGPAMFARLFAVLPLKEVVDHGIILGTSSTRHTLGDKHSMNTHYPEITGNIDKQSI